MIPKVSLISSFRYFSVMNVWESLFVLRLEFYDLLVFHQNRKILVRIVNNQKLNNKLKVIKSFI